MTRPSVLVMPPAAMRRAAFAEPKFFSCNDLFHERINFVCNRKREGNV
jgi:hypothetical protein